MCGAVAASIHAEEITCVPFHDPRLKNELSYLGEIPGAQSKTARRVRAAVRMFVPGEIGDPEGCE